MCKFSVIGKSYPQVVPCSEIKVISKDIWLWLKTKSGEKREREIEGEREKDLFGARLCGAGLLQ